MKAAKNTCTNPKQRTFFANKLTAVEYQFDSHANTVCDIIFFNPVQLHYNVNNKCRLYNYIKEVSLKICGHVYEEYLLDEISATDSTQYLLQVAIHVQK